MTAARPPADPRFRLPVGLVAGAMLLVLSGCSGGSDATPTVRDTAGAVVEAGYSDVFSLRVGDCVEEPDVDSVSDVRLVPCSGDYDMQIFGTFDQPGVEYTSDDVLRAQGEAGCENAFAPAIGIAYTDSILEFHVLVPSEISWHHGDRTILCAAYDPAGPVTGPLLGAAR